MDTLIIFGAKYLWLVAPFAWGAYFLFSSRAKKKTMALLALIALPFTYIAAKGIGLLYYNPQPFVVGEFTPLISHAADNGFPSDHVLIVAAFASVLLFANRKAGALLFVVALVVGASRMSAGLHHAVDVLGSIAIALAVVSIVYYLVRRARM